MRSYSWRPRWSPAVLLMVVITVVFAIQHVDRVYLGWSLNKYLALSTWGIGKGYIWQLFTFQFLHGGLFHWLCNMIGIWCFGRIVAERLGTAAFYKLYFLSGVIGGLMHLLLAVVFPPYAEIGRYPVVGASAGIFGLIAAFALMEPDGVILLNFFLPMKARWLLYISGGIALFFTLAPPPGPGVAHAAHLGGLLCGLAFMRWDDIRNRLLPSRRLRSSRLRPRELIRVSAAKKASWARHKDVPEELTTKEFISREVDPILDKISSQGIQSLTPDERKILEAARAKMRKR